MRRLIGGSILGSTLVLALVTYRYYRIIPALRIPATGTALHLAWALLAAIIAGGILLVRRRAAIAVSAASGKNH